MKRVLLTLLTLAGLLSYGQVPVINNVTPLTTYPQNKIVITGSGFSSSAAQMQVWFDQVKGTIDAATEFSLTVIVPPQARLANIEVTNLASGLSAKTITKFAPYYNGEAFDASKFVVGASFSSGGADANDICTCDLNADGKPDMATTKNSSGEQVLTVYTNTSTPGSISFTSSSINLGATTLNITCGDLNGDGRPELVANRADTRNEIFVLRNTSAGAITFGTPIKLIMDVGHNAFRVVTRDLNGDGKPEVVVSNSAIVTDNPVYVFVNQSTGGAVSFSSTAVKIPVKGATTTYGLETQDIDGDGKPEILTNQFNNPHLFILRNTSAAGVITFDVAKRIDTDLSLSLNQLATGDFNNDGKQDVAVTNNSATNPKVFVFSNQSTTGTITLASPTSVDVLNSPFGLDVADIDGDKDVDIISSNLLGTTKEISVLLNNGSGSFTKSAVLSRGSRNLRVGDLDGDGKPDIAYVSVNDRFVEVLRNRNCFVPQILQTGPLVICPSQTLNLTSIPNAGATFDWKNSTNLSVGSSANLSVTTADTYTVNTSSEGGACLKSASIIVNSGAGTVSDPVISSNAPSGICVGQTLNLQSNDATNTHQWTGPNNFTSSSQNPSIASVTSAGAGTYSLQVSNPSGCKSNVVTKVIDVVNLGNFVVSTPVTANQICAGASLTLSVNYANGHSFQWIKDGANAGSAITTSPVTFSATLEGAYKVRVVNIALGCNKETDAVEVKVLSQPVASFSNAAAACLNQSVLFTNNSTLDSRATAEYAWTFGDGSTSTVQNPSKTYSTIGTKAVQLTVSYAGTTCSNSVTKNIVVSAALIPVINATVNPICPGDPSELSVTGTYSTYSWTGPTQGSGATLSITQPGDYKVNTTEANGCTGEATFKVDKKNTLAVSVIANENPVTEGSEVLFSPGIPVQLTASALPAGVTTFAWSPPDGLDNPAIANPRATPTTELEYTVTASQAGICSGSLTFLMKLDPEGAAFFAQNAFSPNGDSFNDTWVIANPTAFESCTISVYNKQGSKVFEQRGYSNTWDGTYEGKELPQGTYYYVVSCPDKKPVTGHVLLAR